MGCLLSWVSAPTRVGPWLHMVSIPRQPRKTFSSFHSSGVFALQRRLGNRPVMMIGVGGTVCVLGGAPGGRREPHPEGPTPSSTPAPWRGLPASGWRWAAAACCWAQRCCTLAPPEAPRNAPPRQPARCTSASWTGMVPERELLSPISSQRDKLLSGQDQNWKRFIILASCLLGEAGLLPTKPTAHAGILQVTQ